MQLEHPHRTFDAAGPLGAGERFGYRLNGGAENRRSFREFVETDRLFLAPVLTWQATPDTTVALEGEFLRNDQTFDRGVVAVGNRLGVIPRSRFLGEHKPASTAAFVDRLMRPEWLIEIEAIAARR